MNKLLQSFVLSIALMIPTQAQTLTKTQLESEEMKWVDHSQNIDGIGSDEDNYYFAFSVYNLILRSEKTIFILNKDLTSMKSYPVLAEKNESYLTSILTSDHILIFLTRYDKSTKQRVISKQTYSKTNGNLIKQEVIGGVPAKSLNHLWKFYSSYSPDSSKLGIVFMIIKPNGTTENYLAAIIDNEGETVWKSLQNFIGSNYNVAFENFAVNNKDQLYLVFDSYPDKKSQDKSSYIDLIILSEGERSKSSIRLSEYYNNDLKVKILKNEDIYISAVLQNTNSNKPTSIASILVDPKDLDVKENVIEDFVPNSTLRDNFGMEIIDIVELDNNDIVVLCEQNYTYIYSSQHTTSYTRYRGTVMTVFISPNGSIGDINFMKKIQINRVPRPLTAKEMSLSITPFVYRNKICYLFNKLLPKRKRDENEFLNNDGDNVIIAMSMQSNGNEEEIIELSGSSAANRLFRELLFVENDRLIILTQTTNKAYIETITFE